jgi:glycosyltransferase involved in cell wall biosynthesis
LVSEGGVDVVHDTFGALLPLVWRKRRHPSVWFLTSLHGLVAWRSRHVWSQLSTWYLLRHHRSTFLKQWIEKKICLSADRIFVQAPGLVDRVLEDIPVARERIGVLLNSVDTDYWVRPDPPLRERTAGDKCRLLFVGGIDYSRGIFVLIEVMRLLKEQACPAHLTIVGRWGALAKDEALGSISDHGLENDISIVPPLGREGLRELYRDSDMFLYQTNNDGTPRVVLEALACGLPVVASRHPGIDVIDPQDDFIAFTDFGDADRMARFVLDFSERPDLWQERANAGRHAVDDRFSIPAVARQYVEFYQALTANALAERASAT